MNTALLKMEQIDETQNSEHSEHSLDSPDSPASPLSPEMSPKADLSPSKSHKRLSYGQDQPSFGIKLEKAPEDTPKLEKKIEQLSRDVLSPKSGDALKTDDLMPALPILPKSTFEFRLPPRCPLENIDFIQLRKLIPNPERMEKMDFGFDLVDAKIKDRKRAEMIRDGKNPDTWKPDSKMPGFSMGPAPSQKPETVEK